MSQRDSKDSKDRDMHGEGNPEADRRYREGLKQFQREGRVEPAAHEAKEEVEEGSKTRGEERK